MDSPEGEITRPFTDRDSLFDGAYNGEGKGIDRGGVFLTDGRISRGWDGRALQRRKKWNWELELGLGLERGIGTGKEGKERGRERREVLGLA